MPRNVAGNWKITCNDESAGISKNNAFDLRAGNVIGEVERRQDPTRKRLEIHSDHFVTAQCDTDSKGILLQQAKVTSIGLQTMRSRLRYLPQWKQPLWPRPLECNRASGESSGPYTVAPGSLWMCTSWYFYTVIYQSASLNFKEKLILCFCTFMSVVKGN